MKCGIFLGLTLMVYCIIVLGFNNALEKGKPPLPAFFRFNTIFLLSSLLLAFLCFSEYTRKKDAIVTDFGDNFKHINWLPWGLITALIVALLAVSKRRQSDRETDDA